MQGESVQVAAEIKGIKDDNLASPRGYLETILVRAIRKIARLFPATFAEENCLPARLNIGKVEKNGSDPEIGRRREKKGQRSGTDYGSSLIPRKSLDKALSPISLAVLADQPYGARVALIQARIEIIVVAIVLLRRAVPQHLNQL